LFPKNKVSVYKRKNNCIDVNVYSNNLIKLFPQHGKGPKHLRKIQLEDWQQEILKKNRKAFILGLLHSDGCLFTNKVGKYTYNTFQFTNKSIDIINLFRDSLRHENIGCNTYHRKDNVNIVRISRKKDVDTLMEFWYSK
jgi:hypothetical protein